MHNVNKFYISTEYLVYNTTCIYLLDIFVFSFITLASNCLSRTTLMT